MLPSLPSRVADLIRDVASQTVVPRYRALASDQIEEKAPGDLVTIADQETEAMLSPALVAMLPGSRVIGEEACARDPALLADIDSGAVWIVDPIDGTGNFAAGMPPFAVMVALLRDGAITGSWIHDPLTGRMAIAEAGSGAWIDGVRIRTKSEPRPAAMLSGVVSHFALPDGMSAPVSAVEAGVGAVVPTRRCAGDEYPLVALGERDFALYWRTLVWDHAPGVLLLTEAGGVARRPDGRPYHPHEPGTGILLAHTPDIAETIERLLREGGAGR